MLANFFIKHVRGNLFRFFADNIMGCQTIKAVLPSTYQKQLINQQIKERIENTIKNNGNVICEKINNDLRISNVSQKNKYVQSQIVEKRYKSNVKYMIQKPTYTKVKKGSAISCTHKLF